MFRCRDRLEPPNDDKRNEAHHYLRIHATWTSGIPDTRLWAKRGLSFITNTWDPTTLSSESSCTRFRRSAPVNQLIRMRMRDERLSCALVALCALADNTVSLLYAVGSNETTRARKLQRVCTRDRVFFVSMCLLASNKSIGIRRLLEFDSR